MIASVPSQRFASAGDAIEALSKTRQLESEMELEHLEKNIDNLNLKPSFTNSETAINYSPLSINSIFEPEKLEIKVIENFEAFQYFEAWESSEEFLHEDTRTVLQKQEGTGKAANIIKWALIIILCVALLASLFVAEKTLLWITRILWITILISCVLGSNNRRAIKFRNTLTRDTKITSIEIDEFKAIFSHFLRPNESKTIPVKQIICIELEVDGFSSLEDFVRLSIKLATQSNTFYVISNLEQMLALEIAIAIASWLEVDLIDRRITLDDQKLIPISQFDRDSWKRYRTEE